MRIYECSICGVLLLRPEGIREKPHNCRGGHFTAHDLLTSEDIQGYDFVSIKSLNEFETKRSRMTATDVQVDMDTPYSIQILEAKNFILGSLLREWDEISRLAFGQPGYDEVIKSIRSRTKSALGE